jgi:hypothetical protein
VLPIGPAPQVVSLADRIARVPFPVPKITPLRFPVFAAFGHIGMRVLNRRFGLECEEGDPGLQEGCHLIQYAYMPAHSSLIRRPCRRITVGKRLKAIICRDIGVTLGQDLCRGRGK